MKYAPLECAVCGRIARASDWMELRLGPGDLVGAHATCVVELLKQVRRERGTGQRELFGPLEEGLLEPVGAKL